MECPDACTVQVEEGLSAASLDLSLLLLYNWLLFLVAFHRFARMDVTPGSALGEGSRRSDKFFHDPKPGKRV